MMTKTKLAGDIRTWRHVAQERQDELRERNRSLDEARELLEKQRERLVRLSDDRDVLTRTIEVLSHRLVSLAVGTRS